MKDTTVMTSQYTTVQGSTLQVKFPLTRHPRGWCKKIGGQVVVICGHVSPDEALRHYHQKLPAILARQQARAALKGTAPLPAVTPIAVAQSLVLKPALPCLTVGKLRDLYYAKKRADVTVGAFADSSLIATVSALDYFSNRIGGPIDELSNQQFADYRNQIARKYTTTTLDRMVTQVRAMFAWGVRNHHITQLPPWGDSFNKVPAKLLRAYRQEKQRKNGRKFFEADEIKTMLAHASPVLQAMILLGINCGMNNGDVTQLTTKDFNITTGILDYPRRKNHTERRAVLWEETIKALQIAMKARPAPASKQHRDHVFLTTKGHPVCRITPKADGSKGKGNTKVDGLSSTFYQLMERSELLVGKGRNFSALRHTFRTVADELGDKDSIDRIMGHASTSIAQQHYVHLSSGKLDKRLRVITDFVHDWLYGAKATAAVTNTIVVSHL